MSYARKALIVDSNLSSASLLSKRLNDCGFQADQANSLNEVISYLEKEKKMPDIIIVDIASNDSKLIELPQEIKFSLPWAEKIPVVAFTANSNRKSVIDAIGNGYADYIIRPLTGEAFVSRIRNVVEKVYSFKGESYCKAIDEKAIISGDIQLLEINEFGVRALSKMKFVENQVFQLNSKLFEKLEMNPACISVSSCVPDGNGQFLLALRFVGILPAQATLIRKFLMKISSDTENDKKNAS